jgi:hypothetical protein
MLAKISYYINKYPSRVAGYISALIMNTALYFKHFPTSLFIPVVMLIIMFGEGAQRKEDKKTLMALYTYNNPTKPDEQILDEMLQNIETENIRGE